MFTVFKRRDHHHRSQDILLEKIHLTHHALACFGDNQLQKTCRNFNLDLLFPDMAREAEAFTKISQWSDRKGLQCLLIL